MTTDILLVTLNSTYQHTSFGLRYLYSNLKELRDRAEILELTIAQNPRDMVEKILEKNPRLVGFGIYIWNTRQTEDVIRILKKIRPDILVVLGGPEVSHEPEQQSIVQIADYLIKGEADFLFYEFCKKWLCEIRPEQKIISGPLPEISQIELPYECYSDEDIKNRVIYVEASRGCPYKCEYCLSSLDKSVRNFPLDSFLQSIDKLISRGARQFKFVDRTFNLSPTISQNILLFFLNRMDQGLFLHFEMVPDRLPDELKNLIEKFPPGSLQFEIGIQTWNPVVAANVSRKQDYKKIVENLTYLKEKTNVHSHVDLIVGLPGESLESFAQGFDSLALNNPDEIQVGLLKRLKGTPIIRHDHEFKMIYQEHPPFQILQNKDLSYLELQMMNRFSKFWDLYANSGHFIGFMKWLAKLETSNNSKSLFWKFYDFSKFLLTRHKESHGISLLNLFESAWIYMNLIDSLNKDSHRQTLIEDYSRDKKRDTPNFLKGPLYSEGKQNKSTDQSQAKQSPATPARQQRMKLT